jgi:hypothetical protein
MLNGQFRGISQAKLLECLARLGRDVQIVVGPDHFPARTGHVAANPESSGSILASTSQTLREQDAPHHFEAQ